MANVQLGIISKKEIAEQTCNRDSIGYAMHAYKFAFI